MNSDPRLIEIPDLWHLAMALRDWGMEPASAAVLETWHLAHDMKKTLIAISVLKDGFDRAGGDR